MRSSYKILVIPAWFNHENKMEGIFISQFCETLQANGVSVTLLYVKPISIRRFYQYFRKIKFNFESGFRIIVVKKILMPLPFLKDRFSFFKNRLFAKLSKKLNREKFDLIHAQSMCNNLTPLITENLARNLHIPYVITEHYSSFKEAGNILFRPYTSMDEVIGIVKKAQLRMGVSKFACKKFEDFFNSDYVPFPNFINPIYFNPIANEKIDDSVGDFSFISIAALEKHKGLHVLIEGFANAFAKNDRIKLKILGAGGEEENLKKSVNEKDLGKQIYFCGQLSPEQSMVEIDKSDVLVSASFYETFGLTVAEALLRGKPVIATKSGGVQELVNEENGYLCEVNNVDDLSGKMLDIYRCYSTFNRQNIRDNIAEKLSEKKLIAQLEEHYSKVVHKN